MGDLHFHDFSDPLVEIIRKDAQVPCALGGKVTARSIVTEGGGVAAEERRLACVKLHVTVERRGPASQCRGEKGKKVKPYCGKAARALRLKEYLGS